MTTPDSSESWIDPIFDAVVSDAQASGYFNRVNKHEPKRAPGYGITAAVWVQSISPLPAASGLDATTGRVLFMLRMFTRMLQEPQDMIDPMMMRAASNLMRRYHDDFDFAGTIRNVDLLGMFGEPLGCIAGYVEQDKQMYRVMDILIPCIVNDIWPQIA